MVVLDKTKCVKCQKCLAVCKRGPLQKSDDASEVVKVVNGVECFECGHCACVCPAGAITLEGPGNFGFIDLTAAGTSYESFIGFIRSRRSVRNYTAARVPGELIARVVDASRFAPTAKNSQGVRVTVVTGGAVRKLAGMTFEFYKKLMDIVSSPLKKYPFMIIAGVSTVRAIERNAPAFEYGYKMWRAGVDLLFYDAPALLVVHADKNLAMPKDDCSYALYAMSLAAESLGLASCINGFFLRAAEKCHEIKKFLKLPAGHEVYGAMTLGYSAVKYLKAPPRRPVGVTHIGPDL